MQLHGRAEERVTHFRLNAGRVFASYIVPAHNPAKLGFLPNLVMSHLLRYNISLSSCDDVI
nr:MAG TPA: hypothetical protein [Caudoviricetes sp.]